MSADAWATYFDLTPWNPAHWIIPLKTVKDLTESPFDDTMEKYKGWRDLMREHLLGSNQGYGRIIDEVERRRDPITMAGLQLNPTMDGMNCDLVWITRQLWTFISRNVTRSFRKTLKSLVSGEELNGLELWRVLWRDNEGGSLAVEVADLGALHAFPPCPSGADLPRYLGEWLTLVQEQGMDLPERHLTTLLTKLLPPDVQLDVKRMNLLYAPYM